MKTILTATSLLVITLISPIAIQAQNVPLPIPGPELGITCEDISVQPGEIFDLVFQFDNPNPVIQWSLTLNSNSPSNCQFLSMNTGAAINAFVAANGWLPTGQCDIFVIPSQVTALMAFWNTPPFSSSIYGNEIYRLTCVAGMTPMEVTLPFFAFGDFGSSIGEISSNGEITVTINDPSVPEEPGLMRGDVNMDNSCNLTDAINLLDYLYVGNFDTSCADACDVDDSGSVNLADAVNLLSGLFGGGFRLEDSCKPDGTPDLLTECVGSNCP
ncbi:MAG: hypothetical protein GWP39_03110 [Planctomycetia bacterium]|jgi:hypothetical protein|nr:hypothetical protein [Planctomycetia bacterium]